MMAIWLGVGQPRTHDTSWLSRLLARLRKPRREFAAASNQRVLDANERVRALEARFEQYEARKLEQYRRETRTAARALKDT